MVIIAIDSSYLCYQAKYAMGHLSAGSMRTGVIFGFVSRIVHLFSDLNGDRIVFCWDSRYSKRRKLFPQYKKKRRDKKTKEEWKEMQIMWEQMALLRGEILPAMGFHNQLIYPGYEADDIISQLTKQTSENITIVTSDEDIYQCLDGTRVRIYNPSKKEYFTENDLKEKHGVSPKQWVRVKAIAGCSTDGVPGIHGVGVGTVSKYLNGKLTKGKKLEQILSSDISKRNTPLVKLPFAGMTHIELEKDRFDVKGFKAMCKKYKMKSLMTSDSVQLYRVVFGYMSKYNPF